MRLHRGYAETRRRGGKRREAFSESRTTISQPRSKPFPQSEDVFSAVNRISRTSTPLLPTLESFPKMADMSQSDVSIPSQHCPGLAPGGGDAWTALQLQGVRSDSKRMPTSPGASTSPQPLSSSSLVN